MQPTRSRSIAMVIGVLALTVATATPASAQAGKEQKAATVAGKWTLTVDGGGPHGNVAMGLTLTQDGSRVTGTFASPHGDIPVDGDYTDGTLKLSTTGDNDSRITFEAKLKDDNTLEGYLSSPMGDMRWTATRNKDGK